LVSQCYDLSTFTNTAVKFDMAFDLETDWDYITFQYSIDAGDTWKILGSSEDENWFNNSRFANDQVAANCYNCKGAQWTGMGEEFHADGGLNSEMREYSHSLSAFDKDGSAETNIIFRFFFQSDDATNEEGVIIDNFVVEESNVLSTTGNEFEGLSVYPNPTSGIVYVSGIETEGASVSIVDITGRTITNNAGILKGNTVEVNIKNLASGAYFMVIENDSYKSVRQIIKN
jgi:bacillolysin